ncbi:MAG: hypothetical protein ACOC7T_01650 [Planctomycetota bacterium]
MPVAGRRTKILFLPVIRGNYDPDPTRRACAAVRAAADELDVDGIFPRREVGSGGLISTDDHVRDYWRQWRGELAEVRALVALSSDFMRERAVQDTVRLLPRDVPVFLMVNNDDPGPDAEWAGDSLCGSLSVHHNLRMLGRRLAGSCRINMNDPDRLGRFLGRFARIAAGIEKLRNMRIATLGVNPEPFATTFANQPALFEAGLSLHPYELITMWGDTVLAAQTSGEVQSYEGPFGRVDLWRPIAGDDGRLEAVKAEIREVIPTLPGEAKVDTIARCFLWVRQVFEQDGIDAGAVHCWPEFRRFFGMAPCAWAMLSNALLRKPVVCEQDVCHAAAAALAWPMTGEAGVILDINNNGWDPRVFNVFHCSQTPPNWLAEPPAVSDYGSVSAPIEPTPFTAVSAATDSEAFRATVFQGRFLREPAPERGSSGWAFVPNLQPVLRAVEAAGIHHFVALKGHLGPDVAEALSFRGLEVEDLSREVPGPDEVELADRREAPAYQVFSEQPRCPAMRGG